MTIVPVKNGRICGETGPPSVRGSSTFISWAPLICSTRPMKTMKQIHIWPNHVRVAHLDIVLTRKQGESLARSLCSLALLGFDTRPANVEVHEEAPVTGGNP